jgi:myo-inositol 2-dehydrogenase/D-chiro-inositol 1-dehydrogenase
VSLVRIAVIGAGRMGRVHLDALRLSRSCETVAVVDPDPAARAAAGVERSYIAVEPLLADGGFDAALIAAPSGLHRRTVEQLAGAGVPILCEKPVGLGVEDARAAGRAAAQAGVLLQVGYWRRFVPELVALRRRIAAGELGRPALVISHQWDEQPPPASFRTTSGGIAVDMAVHEIDAIRWLLGQELVEITAAAAGGDPPADASDPDNAAALARLSGGAAAVITLGRRFPHGDSCWLELFADAGYERVPFMWAADGERAFRAALAAQADAFADAVRGGACRGATAEDAVAALAGAERLAQALGEPPAGGSPA